MDKVILEKLKDKPPLPEEIIETIAQVSTLTGSAVFGGYNQDSDLDYIIPPDFPYMWEDLCQYGIVSQVQDYSNLELSSIYAKTKNGVILNLLFVHSEFYNVWVKTTMIISDIVENSETMHNLTKNKKNRIKLFETIKDMLIEEESNKPTKLEGCDVIL